MQPLHSTFLHLCGGRSCWLYLRQSCASRWFAARTRDCTVGGGNTIDEILQRRAGKGGGLPLEDSRAALTLAHDKHGRPIRRTTSTLTLRCVGVRRWHRFASSQPIRRRRSSAWAGDNGTDFAGALTLPTRARLAANLPAIGTYLQGASALAKQRDDALPADMATASGIQATLRRINGPAKSGLCLRNVPTRGSVRWTLFLNSLLALTMKADGLVRCCSPFYSAFGLTYAFCLLFLHSRGTLGRTCRGTDFGMVCCGQLPTFAGAAPCGTTYLKHATRGIRHTADAQHQNCTLPAFVTTHTAPRTALPAPCAGCVIDGRWRGVARGWATTICHVNTLQRHSILSMRLQRARHAVLHISYKREKQTAREACFPCCTTHYGAPARG